MKDENKSNEKCFFVTVLISVEQMALKRSIDRKTSCVSFYIKVGQIKSL